MWLFKCSLILVSNTSPWAWGKEAFSALLRRIQITGQFSGVWEEVTFCGVPRLIWFLEKGAGPVGGPALVCVRIKQGDEMCCLADGIDPQQM